MGCALVKITGNVTLLYTEIRHGGTCVDDDNGATGYLLLVMLTSKYWLLRVTVRICMQALQLLLGYGGSMRVNATL